MIDNYDDDKAMAELGRRSARYKAIKQCKEKLRDLSMLIFNGNEDTQSLKSLKQHFDNEFNELINILEMEK